LLITGRLRSGFACSRWRERRRRASSSTSGALQHGIQRVAKDLLRQVVSLSGARNGDHPGADSIKTLAVRCPTHLRGDWKHLGELLDGIGIESDSRSHTTCAINAISTGLAPISMEPSWQAPAEGVPDDGSRDPEAARLAQRALAGAFAAGACLLRMRGGLRVRTGG